ncbi:MAG: 50S ribosomal protein L33 [Planctomycetes bacterium]|nr:50S ribosomal protein L33 [Planctomycetota bacterium]
MREPVVLECSSCKSRNYMVALETKGGKKLEVKKFCRTCRGHVVHKSRKA